MKHEEIIKKSSFGEYNGVKILQVKGKPYELGYQHGYHLAGKISLMINNTLLATAGYISEQTGWDLDLSDRMMWKGMQLAEPNFPDFLREEMRGIVDGTQVAGAEISLEQIMLWNTNYDQWCIYSHPHHWTPEDAPPSKNAGSMLPAGGGCSSFCAWGEWAGGDGKLIFGKDEDNFNMPEQLENRMLVVADPDDGLGHCFLTYPGMVGLDGGFNEYGFEVMTQLNSMRYETMAGCGIAVFTRLLLTYAKRVGDAIDVFNKYPRCAGIAYHVADSRNKKAAVVETSSENVCVRYPEEGIKALWQSNHSNCYPGWMGYSGYNMVNDQKPVNELIDVSTIETWQNSLRDPKNLYVQAPSRFERYRELISQYKGSINLGNAQKILTDLYDPYTRKERQKWESSVSNNILCTICALYPNMDFTAKPPVGEFEAHIANMWSLVAYPEAGDFWLAINDFPAQYGGYEYFNLNSLLDRLR
ncbi:MAG: C45 family peptidase [Candidatus Altiarchaeota archaeon]|nr:C45 family peptidase [Candidatus Altiarchaeota archaeon]